MMKKDPFLKLFLFMQSILSALMKIIGKRCRSLIHILMGSIGGFSPFFCIDPDCKDFSIITQKNRIRNNGVYVFPDLSFASFYPLSFFNSEIAFDVVILTDCGSSLSIQALIPDSSSIHWVQCYEETAIADNTDSLVITEFTIPNTNLYYRSIPLKLVSHSESISDKMGMKRFLGLNYQGLKRIKCTVDSTSIKGTVIRKTDDWLSKMKEAFDKVKICIVT